MTDAQVVIEVTRMLHDYAAAVDGRDWAAIAELLDDRVVLTRGEESVHGREAFHEAYRPALESDALASRHVVTNIRVDELGAGAARARAYFEATAFFPDATRRIVGRYDDELARVGDRWLFTHKRNVVEWTADLPAAAQA